MLHLLHSPLIMFIHGSQVKGFQNQMTFPYTVIIELGKCVLKEAFLFLPHQTLCYFTGLIHRFSGFNLEAKHHWQRWLLIHQEILSLTNSTNPVWLQLITDNQLNSQLILKRLDITNQMFNSKLKIFIVRLLLLIW